MSNPHSSAKSMKRLLPFTLVTVLAVLCASSSPAATDTRCYEMRIYYAAPGKLEDLNTRFREHTCKLFEKHGIVNVGYWQPSTNNENKLIYLLAYPSREARDQSWKNFLADPDWRTAQKESEKNGKLVAKAESIFLTATDFSPTIEPSRRTESRVFELRTYTASPGNMENLLTRFRDHTVKIFEKHGMTNFGYWTPTEKKDGAGEKLFVMLSHKSQESASDAFKAFHADPDWIAIKKASEEKAGASLTTQGGVKSEFLVSTDYSQTR